MAKSTSDNADRTMLLDTARHWRALAENTKLFDRCEITARPLQVPPCAIGRVPSVRLRTAIDLPGSRAGMRQSTSARALAGKLSAYMDRGLRSQLSPNEETTLRLLAIAGHDQDLLRLANLEQLHALRLIEFRNGAWVLTEMGSQRLATVRNQDQRHGPWTPKHNPYKG